MTQQQIGLKTHASQIKKIAPDLMLTVSVFTYKAVGRTGPAKFQY